MHNFIGVPLQHGVIKLKASFSFFHRFLALK